ncbi:unnamed protein product [Moneuplotes crassus]|uniref:Uncharacterized protein n=1 Tax=Euplotes crassus TaxID=5936 RepID=A0AAD2D7Y0_EUPCR|nr:unnamed protein product [Moneuplotes crassus]
MGKYRVCIIDTSPVNPVRADSVLIEIVQSEAFEIDLKYRFSLAYSMDYDFIVWINPRSDSHTIRLIHSVSMNIMKLNPRVSVFQFIPFNLGPSKFKYSPSGLMLHALSGTLGFTGKTHAAKGEVGYPHPPTNLLQTSILGIAIANELNLHLMGNSEPKYKLHSLLDDFIYSTYFPVTYRNNGNWNEPQGQNMLDGGTPFYDIYKAKDDEEANSTYLAVGPIETKFFKVFVDELPVPGKTKKYLIQNQHNPKEYHKMKKIISKALMTKTADDWDQIYHDKDAVTAKIIIPKLYYPYTVSFYFLCGDHIEIFENIRVSAQFNITVLIASLFQFILPFSIFFKVLLHRFLANCCFTFL